MAMHKLNYPFALTAQAKQLRTRVLEELENSVWAEKNSAALESHGKDIANTGLAGAEFDRV